MEKYIEIAKEIIDENYGVVGVRGLSEDETYKVGDDCRESYEWDLEADCTTYFTTGLKAGGTCATHIENSYYETDNEITELANRIAEAVKENEAYAIDKQVIIAGNDGIVTDMPLDLGEVRIRNAFVIAVL